MSAGKRTLYATIVLQAFGLAFAILLGHSLGKAQTQDNVNNYTRFAMIDEAVRYIESKYREEDVDRKKLIHGAIKGMMEALDDPYSQFMPPEMYKDTMDDTTGKFGGLGIEISITVANDYPRLTVISTLEGTPAHKAGVEAGDYIIKIDEESTFGISLLEAKHKLRGKPDTKVTITVMRESEEEPIDIVITRDLIEAITVKDRILEDNIGYIKIAQFSDTTPRDVDAALDKFEKANVKGVILDLRRNPGGTLSAAVAVASDFLRKGQLVVYTQGRREEDYKEFRVQKDSPYPRRPLVVLVDQWSASGSEIVVGAIKDHKRGLVIGDEHSTFGKGSVQTIFPMRDGETGLKLTVAHYYTPSGRNINEAGGIEPDIRYPDSTLTPSEAKMYRKLRNRKSLDEFVKEAGDDILRQLRMTEQNGVKNPEKELFNSFVKKLSEENIVLSKDLIKLAIAQKTKDEADEYEHDPTIRFAINHLQALLLMSNG